MELLPFEIYTQSLLHRWLSFFFIKTNQVPSLRSVTTASQIHIASNSWLEFFFVTDLFPMTFTFCQRSCQKMKQQNSQELKQI